MVYLLYDAKVLSAIFSVSKIILEVRFCIPLFYKNLVKVESLLGYCSANRVLNRYNFYMSHVLSMVQLKIEPATSGTKADTLQLSHRGVCNTTLLHDNTG